MKNYDVVIVGSGVIGTSIAYHLSSRLGTGKDILLLDKASTSCHGNTQRSAAKIRDTVASQTNLDLCRSSIEAYKYYQDSGVDLGLKFEGYLWLMTDDQRSRNQTSIDTMLRNGVNIEILDEFSITKLLPNLNLKLEKRTRELLRLEDITCALFGKNCGSIDPELLTRFYERRFLEMGGNKLYNCEVRSLVFDKSDGETNHLLMDLSRVHGVITDKGKVLAENVVLATGAYTQFLLEGKHGIHSGLKGTKKRQLYELATKDFDSIKCINSYFPFTILPYKGIYLYLIKEGEVVVGCSDNVGRPFTLENDPQPEPQFFRNCVMPILIEYFPFLSRAIEKGTTAGMYDYSAEGAPNIDEVINGLVIANGSSGRGIMTADAIGRITASMILGEEETELFGRKKFNVSKLSIDPKKRNVEPELFSL
ncbi:FAD-binding oxidoreductase [Candidatus Woesearchaeota archaeon]|nr:FAD-binding oxidoreductase [Candidatus Woesearchaeota archaeon]